MIEDLYTSVFEEVELQSAPDELRRAISFLKSRQDVTQVYRIARGTPRHGRTKLLVGAHLQLKPYLPSRLDPACEGMQPVEPVVFLFDYQRYPRVAPDVGSDRKNFSWKGKPHVSQPAGRWPPLFCLSRAPLDDWFAEHGFAAFFDRLFDWLIDAAQGKLQREDGRFEPTMVSPLMSCVFDYSRTTSWIGGQREISRKPDYGYGQFNAFRQGDSHENSIARYSMRFEGPVELETASLYVRECRKDRNGALAHGGFVTWMEAGNCTSEHFSTLPNTRSELVEWGRELGLPIEEPLSELVGAGQAAEISQFFVPILAGVRRPRKLFGVESDLEILPLLYYYDAGANGDIERVFFMRHQHLHTVERARHLSNTERLKTPVTLVGGGAFGSKLFEHWYRGGQTVWTLVDDDVLAPHNLARHALEYGAQGRAKVEGLRGSVAGMFEEDTGNSEPVEIAKKSLADALEDDALRKRIKGSFIVDATASPAALHELTAGNMPFVAGAARGFIIDEGRKAALLLEGTGRNPRLDDARAYLYQLGMTEDVVSEWLSRRAQQQDVHSGLTGQEIEVGLGCASDTFQLADDEVSLHAAQVSMRLRAWIGAHHGLAANTGKTIDGELGAKGRVGLSSASGGWQEWTVPSVVVEEDDGWQVRVTEDAVEVMKRFSQEQAPNETGGLALGRINHSRRIVFVTQVLSPPPDSTGTPTKFIRGTKGVRTALAKASRRTGSMIGYVAEWHSHPKGPRRLSGKDFRMARRTRQQYRGSTFPAIVIVTAPSGLAVHVEEGSSANTQTRSEVPSE